MSQLIGQVFGRLTVVSLHSVDANSMTRWNCICECGSECVALAGNLKRGHTLSCGCLRREVTSQRRLIHGECHNTPEYKAWANMISRCYDPANISYERYAGKGVSVCDEWRMSYTAFLAHVGRRPSAEHSLDRYPNNHGNYEPGNVRWATPEEQSNNRRCNRHLTFDGRTQTIGQWAREIGIGNNTLWGRIERGWPIEKALARSAA